MSTIDLIRVIHSAIKDFNKALNDYDATTQELSYMQYDLEQKISELNAYSYDKCKAFYTHYHLTENRKGYCLGADLREKR